MLSTALLQIQQLFSQFYWMLLLEWENFIEWEKNWVILPLIYLYKKIRIFVCTMVLILILIGTYSILSKSCAGCLLCSPLMLCYLSYPPKFKIVKCLTALQKENCQYNMYYCLNLIE